LQTSHKFSINLQYFMPHN